MIKAIVIFRVKCMKKKKNLHSIALKFKVSEKLTLQP